MTRRSASALLAAAVAACAATAQADLYRWVDPETGSVKFSTSPPPWHGKPELERRAPKVEYFPARPPAPPPAAAKSPAAAAKAPAAAATAPAGAAKAPAEGLAAALEARRKELLRQLAVLPARGDFERAGDGVRRQLEAYGAVVAELDRLDPAGAAARRSEGQSLIERLAEALRAQIAAKPPVRLPGGR